MRQFKQTDISNLPDNEGKKEIDRQTREINEIFASTPTPSTEISDYAVYAMVRTKEMRLPKGFQIADGRNGTQDASANFTDTLVYIQKVK